jgi:hypothetical protein
MIPKATPGRKLRAKTLNRIVSAIERATPLPGGTLNAPNGTAPIEARPSPPMRSPHPFQVFFGPPDSDLADANILYVRAGMITLGTVTHHPGPSNTPLAPAKYTIGGAYKWPNALGQQPVHVIPGTSAPLFDTADYGLPIYARCSWASNPRTLLGAENNRTVTFHVGAHGDGNEVLIATVRKNHIQQHVWSDVRLPSHPFQVFFGPADGDGNLLYVRGGRVYFTYGLTRPSATPADISTWIHVQGFATLYGPWTVSGNEVRGDDYQQVHAVPGSTAAALATGMFKTGSLTGDDNGVWLYSTWDYSKSATANPALYLGSEFADAPKSGKWRLATLVKDLSCRHGARIIQSITGDIVTAQYHDHPAPVSFPVFAGTDADELRAELNTLRGILKDFHVIIDP